MTALRTYNVTYAAHILPCGQCLEPLNNSPSTQSITTQVQALNADGAIDLVERDTQRMVTHCQRVPAPDSTGATARAQLNQNAMAAA